MELEAAIRERRSIRRFKAQPVPEGIISEILETARWAPCLVIACVDRNVSLEYAMLDVGLISQTLCLLAYERGLGTCMLGASVRHPKLVRKYVPIPDSKLLVIGTAMGYADWDSPVNTFTRERAEPDEFIRWVE